MEEGAGPRGGLGRVEGPGVAGGGQGGTAV